MTVTVPPSPFLSGLMAPVTDERDDPDLAVTGAVPPGLRGMFVRNGPNPQFAPRGKYHPFDGDGMLHAVYLDEDGARYRNRWIESRGLLAERARGHALYGGLAEFSMPEPEASAHRTFRSRSVALSTESPAAWPNASLIGFSRSTSSTIRAPLAW